MTRVDDAVVLDALRGTFGHASFRPGQEPVVRTVLDGRPTLAVMPTGAGKSLCYQLPAVVLPGLTLVVSPLVALMRDQVDGLARRGVAAACVHGGQSESERRQAERGVAEGRFRLVYVAPERLRSDSFRRALDGRSISLVAVDEAHCVSEWGHAFRPDYELLGDVLGQLSPPRLLALTATASPDVRADVVRALRMRDPAVTVAAFDRPEIRLEVLRVDTEAERLDTVVQAIRKAGPAIVYASTRRRAEALADRFSALGFRSGCYHGGVEPAERARVQDGFSRGSIDVVAATNAFGLGVDKPDVRMVVHAELPRSVEAYYQELGRAGRDGAPATAALVFAPKDIFLQKRLLALSSPRPDLVRRLWRLLEREGRPLGRDRLDALRPAGASKAEVFASLAFLESTGVVRRVGRPGAIRVWLGSGLTVDGESAGSAVARCAAVHGDRIPAETIAGALGCRTPRELWAALDAIVAAGSLRYEAERLGSAYVAVDDARLDAADLLRLRTRASRDRLRLEQMIRLADGAGCRRSALLSALGERVAPPSCGSCDICSGPVLPAVRSRLAWARTAATAEEGTC